MKKIFKVLGIIAIVAVIGFFFTACDGDNDDDGNSNMKWTAVANSTFGTSTIYAIAYGNDKFIAGGDDGKMATSTDGTTWTAVDTGTSFDYVSNRTTRKGTIYAVAYGNGKFVAYNFDDHNMAYSTGD